MVVKEGYKQTEVGVIPEDWEVRTLRDLVRMKSGNSITTKDIKDHGKYPCYGGNGLRGYTHNYTHEGEFALVGRQGALCGNVQFVKGIFFASEHAVVVEPYSETDIKWILYVLKDMNLNQYSESSAQPGLSVNKILKLKAISPKVKIEQRAIATALSDIDGLINSLTKLIEKKKNIKQGAMQELLTGKKRLDGFSGEWVEVRLSDVLEIGHGQSQQRIENIKGKYPILGSSGEIGRTDTFLYDKPSVLIGRKGTINDPQYMDSPFWTIDTLFYTKLKHSISAKFIYYLFCTINWLNYNEASGVPSLSSKTIKSIRASIPLYIEQTAIATILSDMDTEIETLQAKLNKYKAVKQGMMQELLTGRIRLLEGA